MQHDRVASLKGTVTFQIEPGGFFMHTENNRGSGVFLATNKKSADLRKHPSLKQFNVVAGHF